MKRLPYSINKPWLNREYYQINKIGETALTINGVNEDNICINTEYYKYPAIEFFNNPDNHEKRYCRGKFYPEYDEVEMNVEAGVQVITNDNIDNTVTINIIGIKATEDGSEYKSMKEKGYEYVGTIAERYPDNHGEFCYKDFVYDEKGNYVYDENGKPKEWSYRYDLYAYYYKVIA